MDMESHRVFDCPADDLPWWRFASLVEELMLEDLMADPGMVGKSRAQQRERILAALEAPFELNADGEIRDPLSKEIDQLRRQMVDEEDFEKRMDLRDRMLDLIEEQQARGN